MRNANAWLARAESFADVPRVLDRYRAAVALRNVTYVLSRAPPRPSTADFEGLPPS